MRQHHPIELDVARLDHLIHHWRKIWEDPGSTEERRTQAFFYIGAFQTVRVEHGLPRLPSDEGD